MTDPLNVNSKTFAKDLKSYEEQFQNLSLAKDHSFYEYLDFTPDQFFEKVGATIPKAMSDPEKFQKLLEVGGPEALRIALKTKVAFEVAIVHHKEYPSLLTQSDSNYMCAIQQIKKKLDEEPKPASKQAFLKTLSLYNEEWQQIKDALPENEQSLRDRCDAVIQFAQSVLDIHGNPNL